MLTTTPLSRSNTLRDTITNAYRMDEAECLSQLIPQATLSDNSLAQIATLPNSSLLKPVSIKSVKVKSTPSCINMTSPPRKALH